MTGRARPHAITQTEMAAELARLVEVVDRLEETVSRLDAVVTTQGDQIKRWRWAGQLIAPVLLALGAALHNVFDDLLIWLGTVMRAKAS